MTTTALFDSNGIDWRTLAETHGTPLLVLDCDRIGLQYDALARALPGVELHYAIKSLPHPEVVRTLAARSARFDLATQGEVDLVEGLGIDARRTIHTHPIKTDQDIRRALRYGCTTFVADNSAELAKFTPYRHRVALLLRVAFRDPDAQVDLSAKFGCAPEALNALLAEADRRELHVKGLSFHVGSQAAGGTAQADAIRFCAEAFTARRRNARAPLSVLDIGGGFPVSYDGRGVDIEAFCAPIRSALAALPDHVRVIAEPGRFISAPAMTSISGIVGVAERGGRPWYYLDDGVYGSFSGRIYDHARYPLIPLTRDAERDPFAGGQVTATLAGPTCDSIDVIAEDAALGALEIGDYVIAPMIGAYSSASATTFNSIPRTPILAINTVEEQAPELRIV